MKRPAFLGCLPLAALAALAGTATAQTIWYVDDGAPPGGSGTSWSSAFADLQSALSAAQSGDQVWVAEGLYRPSLPSDPNDPRSVSFLVPADVAIYGGFLGYETTLAQRAGSFDLTALDGDIGQAGVATDNAYHVVSMVGAYVFTLSVLDGFTVRNGYAVSGGTTPMRGAGVYVTLANFDHGPALVLAHCTVRDNVADDGAGIANVNLGHVKLKDCRVVHNVALGKGGGYFGLTALITSANTRWHHNRALQDGGAVFTNSTTLEWTKFFNDVMHDNQADRGGAIALGGSQFVAGSALLECATIAYNRANTGGGIFSTHAGPYFDKLQLENSIVWGNRAANGPQISGNLAPLTVIQSNVQGGWPGQHNLEVDPQFADVAARDFRLRAGSRCIDAGDATLVGGDLLDLDGDGLLGEKLPRDFRFARRFRDDPTMADSGVPFGAFGTPDLGAFER